MPTNAKQAPSLFDAITAETLWVAVKDDRTIAENVHFRYTADLCSLEETLAIYGLEPLISEGTVFKIIESSIMAGNNATGQAGSHRLTISADHSGSLLVKYDQVSFILQPAKK